MSRRPDSPPRDKYDSYRKYDKNYDNIDKSRYVPSKYLQNSINYYSNDYTHNNNNYRKNNNHTNYRMVVQRKDPNYSNRFVKPNPNRRRNDYYEPKGQWSEETAPNCL